MNAGVELLADLHKANVKLLDAHPDGEILDLMDRAAIAGALHGANVLLSTMTAELAVMVAKAS